MWSQEPTEMFVEAVGGPVQSPAAGTCRSIRLPAAEEEVAVVEEVAAVEELAAVGDQRAGLVPSREEASGPAGTTQTAGIAGWPVS